MVGIWGIGFGISIWKSKRKERVFLDICQSGKTCREWISKQALELMEKFDEMLQKEESLGYIYRLAKESDQMLKATLANDTKTMEKILSYVHDTETPILSYNHETELSAIVNLAYLSARDQYHIEREDKAGKGFVDFIFYPYDRTTDGVIIMSVIGAVAIIIIPSIRFGKRIKKQMQPVLDAIGQIKDQNLEYETSCSGIKEFDDCLSAIDDMRDALRESLEKQWKTEQEKKQQMSALAHDIKTPLTIVRGNAELLSETELTTEQKKNITYVLNGTTQIQSYVKQLIDVTKSWNCSDVTYTTVRLEDFFADIKEQALGLVEIYHQKIDWKAEQSDKKVTIAYDPMLRAVMNVIQNAVEHTKENGIIYIDAKEQDDRLTFIVEDSGSGFTKEALLHGTEQFFMDDTSRNGKAHYGIGLFFAKTVAEKYGGGIKLSNSENTGGARVEIFFLSSQETS